MKTREEWIAFAKRRALEYVDAGDLDQAVASLGMDLRNSGLAELDDHPGVAIGLQLLMAGLMTPEKCRRWVEGFR